MNRLTVRSILIYDLVRGYSKATLSRQTYHIRGIHTSMGRKYQKEIEEILEDSGVSAPKFKRNSVSTLGSLKKFVNNRIQSTFTSISKSQIALAGLAILLVSLLFQSLISWALPIVGAIVMLVLLIAYFKAWSKPQQNYEKRWRGQAIDDGRRPSIWERLLGKSDR